MIILYPAYGKSFFMDAVTLWSLSSLMELYMTLTESSYSSSHLKIVFFETPISVAVQGTGSWVWSISFKCCSSIKMSGCPVVPVTFTATGLDVPVVRSQGQKALGDSRGYFYMIVYSSCQQRNSKQSKFRVDALSNISCKNFLRRWCLSCWQNKI